MTNATHPIFQSLLAGICPPKKVAADFESHVQGIPCGVVIIDCVVVAGSYSYNAPSDVDYHGYAEVEFELIDRKGYPAKWLEKMMTPADIERIDNEIIDHNTD